MTQDTLRKVKEMSEYNRLQIKRDISGNVLFQTIASGSAGTTTTVTTGAPVIATQVTAVGQGATPTWTGTIKRNGVTLTSGTGITTLSTSTVLDRPSDAPNKFTINISLGAATTVSYTVSRESRIG